MSKKKYMIPINYENKRNSKAPQNLERSVEYRTEKILKMDDRDYKTGASKEEVDERNLPTSVKGLQATYSGEGVTKTALVNRYLPQGMKEKVMRHELDHAEYGAGENRADIAAGLTVRSIEDPSNKSGWLAYYHPN